ncbi:MAG: FMN-binding protein [Spirochaetaceae bacterium]|jgi:uncharacterized protein with FMN-binding domain|nr:FMN-binding protein [Spirochaetaceae bacterium]
MKKKYEETTGTPEYGYPKARHFPAVLRIGIPLLCFAFLIANCATGLKNETIGTLNLAGKADGVYRGEYKTWPLKAVVDVTLQDETIKAITLVKHTYGKGKKAEGIIEGVIKAQSLLVDTVSGATASSKTILLAIQRALR